MNATTSATTRVNYLRELGAGRVTRHTFMGRQAVFTTYEGERMVGEITGTRDNLYLVVTFPDGRTARLDDVVELVA